MRTYMLSITPKASLGVLSGTLSFVPAQEPRRREQDQHESSGGDGRRPISPH